MGSQTSVMSCHVDVFARHGVGTQNWHKTRFAGNQGEPVRPVIKTGQTGQDNFVKLSIGLHHCVDLVEAIEIHI